MNFARSKPLPALLLVGLLGATAACAGANAGLDARVSPGDAYEVPGPRTPEGDLSPEARALRAKGRQGLVEALQRLDATPEGDVGRAAAAKLVDDVAQQHDADVARLYWYTDIEEAKKAASAAHKPILSLRMLGSLTDAYSCANSRFFRAILYPDARIRSMLEENFILHWSSERPAPLITIDFRDGRKVTRTITGNSVHYVLAANGEPLDALPGLVSQSAFLRWLSDAKRLDERVRGAGAGGLAIVRDHHRAELARTVAVYNQIARDAGVSASLPLGVPGLAAAPQRPSAALAIPVAPSKARVEAPMAGAIAPKAATAEPPTSSTLESIPWQRLSAAYLSSAVLSPDGLKGLRRKNPQNWSNPSAPRPLSEPEFQEMVAEFQASLAEDTVKNTLGLHAVVHAWFLSESGPGNFRELNTKMYTTLFMTPKDDPWLGLVPARAFSGIDHDGISAKP